MAIKCCKGCVAPKRHKACWDSCPEYIAERAEYDRCKAVYDQKKNIDSAIYANRSKKVYKAMRDREMARRAKGR